jgi:type VI protein secretion system component Hcp
MSKSVWHVGVLVVAALLVAGSSSAAFDAFLKVPGVQGDSSNALHPAAQGWMEVQSWSWGVGRAMTGGVPGSMGPGRLTIDTSSPKLMQLCATGQHFPKLVVGLQGREYVLDNVSVLSVSHRMAPMAKGTPSPEESISLNFTKIEFEYGPLATGKAKGSQAHIKQW